MNRFEGKVVIVTGAGSGIGAGTARRFLREGASVVLNGRRELKLRETIAGFDPANSLVHPGDVSDEEYVKRLVEDTTSKFGKLDVLVNNAAIAFFGHYARKVSFGRSLYLMISPKGGRYWRYRYRFQGRENALALGCYPDVPIETARARHEAARRLLVAGIDPSGRRKALRQISAEQL